MPLWRCTVSHRWMEHDGSRWSDHPHRSTFASESRMLIITSPILVALLLLSILRHKSRKSTNVFYFLNIAINRTPGVSLLIIINWHFVTSLSTYEKQTNKNFHTCVVEETKNRKSDKGWVLLWKHSLLAVQNFWRARMFTEDMIDQWGQSGWRESIAAESAVKSAGVERRALITDNWKLAVNIRAHTHGARGVVWLGQFEAIPGDCWFHWARA